MIGAEFNSDEEWLNPPYRVGVKLHPLTIEQNAITSFRSRTTLVPNVGVDIKRIAPDLSVYAYGKVGKDDKAEFLLDALRRNGVNADGIKRAETLGTSFTQVMSVEGGERTFFTYAGASADFGYDDIDFDKITAKIFHLGYFLLLEKVDNGDGVKILKELKNRGIKTSIDLVSSANGGYEKVLPCLPFVDYLIINELESAALCKSDNTDDLRLLAEKLKAMGVKEGVIIHKAEPNLDLYLNTRMRDVQMKDNVIVSIEAEQMTTEKLYRFNARYFADTTGDGFLGYCAGAEFMYGRESRYEFNEKDAPETHDNKLMGNSLMFTAKDMGYPVPFEKPDWAYSYSEEDLKRRDHSEITSGYWWIEASSSEIIEKGDDIRQELVKMLFGIWDHIKNVPGHNAENYALDWIGALPGKRESRRLKGDYVLTENDLVDGKGFYDAVAYGGWNMDMHENGNMSFLDSEPTTYFSTKYIYSVPYRCLYSVNIDNLFLGGRAISVSHMVFGSTRVMATCAVIGQAVGTAAALCNEKGISPRELTKHIEELQRTLVLDDCYIPNYKLLLPNDLARTAVISASSEKYPVENLVNGELRNYGRQINCWQSDGIAREGEWIRLNWSNPQTIKSLILRFDSDLSSELTITLSDKIRAKQKPFPNTLVKNYSVYFYNDKKLVKKIEKTNNFLRLNRLETEVIADEIEIRFSETYGADYVSVYSVNILSGLY